MLYEVITYEQITMIESLIEGVEFLKEGQEVEIVFHAELETALSCELPPFIVAEVTYTEPGLKGDTSTNALKPATIETGSSIMVPLFIEIGEKIKVDTRTKEYVITSYSIHYTKLYELQVLLRYYKPLYCQVMSVLIQI